ncbi:Mu transposase domain-containing protein [Ferroacidibacillus organovorans]
MQGRDRLEQESFLTLQAHYLFHAEYCNVRKGNEKGRVEKLVGTVRRRALVPLPDVQSMDELNELLHVWCETNAQEDLVPHRQETIAAVFEREKAVLHALPPKAFEACRMRSGNVSKMSTVTFETNAYSVPSQYVLQRIFVKAFVDEVHIVAQNDVIARHKRCNGRDQMILVLDHYLDVLVKKPRAIRDAQAMYATDIPEIVRQFQREMRTRHGAQGDRSFIRFLLLYREVGMSMIASVLTQAHALQILHFDGLHDLLLRQTGKTNSTPSLSNDKVPTDLHAYRVHKTDLTRYNALTSGGAE